MNDVLVSINCITYNHETYIKTAIESFLMQKTDFSFEVIVGEDCSTDNTRNMIKECQKKYPDKIKLLTSDNNIGARNNERRNFDESKGKYIAICEGDDYWTDPYKLQKQVDYMEKHPECGLIFHGVEKIYEDNKRDKKIIRNYDRSKNCSIEEIIYGGGSFCPSASMLYRKSLWDETPEFYNRASVGDYPMQMYFATKGEVYYLNEIMAVYRSGHINSWTHKCLSSVKENISHEKSMIKMLNEFNKYSNKKYHKVVRKTQKKHIIRGIKYFLSKKYPKIYSFLSKLNK